MISSQLSEITNQLTSLSDTPALDASVLLAHILHKPRTWVVAHPELTFTTEQQKQLDDSLRRLERGESFPYVLGHWDFYGMDFEVTPDVLIPRPETELLVDRAIAWLKESPLQRSVADIGTGSGVIAISIAVHVPAVHVLATDISPPALEVARRNAGTFDVLHKVDFVQCDLLPARNAPLLRELRFDLICANLPYIPTETLHNLPVFGREPTLALDGGDDGLELIRRLLRMAPDWLAPDGMILLEIESTRGSQTSDLAHNLFPEAAIYLHQDLTGRDRLLEIRL
ncbi:MAG TPA: peptide chain release factor N(5)-glutamine methyltransferase [Anaerolineales bacterium]|nr:peptide chain release factor N(5)-glutamine methyltransferase [Anaerolineales bacterium]